MPSVVPVERQSFTEVYAVVRELMFDLEVEADWPPVAQECLPIRQLDSGYRIDAAPLFVKGLSAGDIIDVERFEDGSVKKWTHLHKSPHSTAWLLVRSGSDPEPALECLKRRKCNIVSFPPQCLFSIDIPETCSLEEFDACINLLAEEDRIGVVFPSMRHPD